MNTLLENIRNCTVCQEYLPMGPRPILSASAMSKIILIGQAPGQKVHKSGIPWDDPSGNQLRSWLNVSRAEFYDADLFTILPMGFCYPGKGKSGDLPPRPECAPLWHDRVLAEINYCQMILLIGNFAQRYYLKHSAGKNLTETVKQYKSYLPRYFPLPHPSPRNRFWLKKNPWFEKDLLPVLKSKVSATLMS